MYRASRQTQLTWTLKTIQLPDSCPACHIISEWQGFLFVSFFYGGGVCLFVCFFFPFFFLLLPSSFYAQKTRSYQEVKVSISKLHFRFYRICLFKQFDTLLKALHLDSLVIPQISFFDTIPLLPSCLPLLDPPGIPQWVFLLWHNLPLFQLSHSLSSSWATG